MGCLIPPTNLIVQNQLATGNQVIPKTAVKLSWDTMNGVSGYNVYRNLTPYGQFAQLTSLIGLTTFFDNAVPIVPETDPYYVVTTWNPLGESAPTQPATYDPSQAFTVSPFGDVGLTLTAGTVQGSLTIPSGGAMLPTNLQQPYYFQDVRKRNLWMLEQDGQDVWLFKRNLKEINVNTDEDYGREAEVAYFTPIKIKVRLVETAAFKELASYGLRKSRLPRSWTVWAPRLHDRDIIIDSLNRRYEILNVTKYDWRGLITHQDFELIELERTDKAYNHPQLVVPAPLQPYP